MDYTLTRSKRRTVALYIRTGGLEVRAPLKLPKREIDKFVASKEKWITDRLAASREQSKQLPHSFYLYCYIHAQIIMSKAKRLYINLVCLPRQSRLTLKNNQVTRVINSLYGLRTRTATSSRRYTRRASRLTKSRCISRSRSS